MTRLDQGPPLAALDRVVLVLGLVLIAGLTAVFARQGHLVFAAGFSLASLALLLRARSTFLVVALFAPVLNLTSIDVIGTQPTLVRWAPAVFTSIVATLLVIREPRLLRLRLEQMVPFAFFGMAALSVLWSVNATTTLERTAALFLIYVATFIVLRWTFLEEPRADRFLGVALWGAVALLAATVIYSIYLGPTLHAASGPRYGGIFDNPNWGGLIATLTLPLAIWWTIERNRWAGLTATVIITVGLLVSGHRTSLLAVAVAVPFLLPRRYLLLTIITGGVAAVILGALLLGGPLTDSPLGQYLRLSNPLSDRTIIWGMGLDLLPGHWVAGHGFGTEDALMPYDPRHPLRGAYFHNSFLGLTLQVGLVGLVLFFGPLLWLIFSSRTSDLSERSIRARALRAILIAGLALCIGESWIYAPGHGLGILYWGAASLLLHLRATDLVLGAVPSVATSSPKRRPRTLFTVQAYHPYHLAGGPAVKIRSMARELHKRGHDVTILTMHHGAADGWSDISAVVTATRYGHLHTDDGVQVHYVKPSIKRRLVAWSPAIRRFARDHVKTFDQVHVFGTYDFLGPTITRSARRAKIPYLVEPLGMYLPLAGGILSKRLYRALFAGPMMRGASRVVATSPKERDDLVRSGVPAAWITVRRNGIDTPPLVTKGTVRSSLGIPSDAPLIAYVGRISRIKSVDMLVEAVARLPPATHLVIMGPDDGDGMMTTVMERRKALGLDARVHVLPSKYDDTKWRLLADADVLVLCSISESFGNSAAEAIVAGVPVVVTRGCGIAPLVDGVGGLVVSHDTDSLAKGLGDILSDRSLLAKLRTGAQGLAPELTWEKPMEETERLYRDLRSA